MNADLIAVAAAHHEGLEGIDIFRYTPTTVKSSVEPYRVVLKVLPTAFSTPNSILALSVSMTILFPAKDIASFR